MGGRGDNVSRWKPEEFRKAREEWDPRLIAAITAYGPGKAASDNAANLLIELLQAPPTQSPTPNAGPTKFPPAAEPTAPAGPTAPAAPGSPAPPLAAGPPQLQRDTLPDPQTITGQVPYDLAVELTEEFITPDEIVQNGAPKSFPAGFRFPPGSAIPDWFKFPASAKVTLVVAAPVDAAAAGGAAPQLEPDADGNLVIPAGVTVTLTEPMPIPPELAAKMKIPAGGRLPAGFTIPSGFKFPPGFQLPPSAKISGAEQTPAAPAPGAPAPVGIAPVGPNAGMPGPGGMNIPGMPPMQAQPTAPPSEQQVVEAIVLALGANKTETARSALRKLLKGEMPTSISDPIVSGYAAKAMLIRPTDREQAGLIAAAANPSMIRKGAVPVGLQQELLAALDEKATTKMRIDLVDAVLKPTASADQRKTVTAMLSTPRAENMPAQARLFKDPKLDEALKKSLFEQFAAYSAAAIDQLLETPASSSTAAPAAAPGVESDGEALDSEVAPAAAPAAAAPVAAARNKPLDPKTLQAVIEGIWGEDVVERLKADGARSDEFKDFESQLPLAVTVPVSDVRAALLGIVRDGWAEGPSALAMGGSLGERLRDPGALFVVKRSPRLERPVEKPLKEGETAREPSRSSRNRSGRQGDENSDKERQEKKEKEDKARYDWMDASEEFARALNARFYAAAQAGGGQRHKVTQETSGSATTGAGSRPVAFNARFPLKLHDGARITAEYHVCLPDDLPEALKGVKAPPLIVHYVRTEDVSSFPKVNSNYLAQLKGVSSHVRSDSRWLDWTGAGTSGGMSRTVDVFIQRSGGAAAPSDGGKSKGDDAVPIVTEILVIEVPSFRPPRDDQPK